MIQNFITTTLIQHSECENVNCLSVRAEEVGNLITKRNLLVRVDVSSMAWSEPTIRFNPTIYTRGCLPYKNPPLSYSFNRNFRNKTSVQLEKSKQSDFDTPIQFLIDWAQKYGAYEGYFVYNKESDPSITTIDIKKHHCIRHKERIDKVKNLEIKLRSSKSNKENMEKFVKESVRHSDHEGYHDMIKYYTIDIERITDKIKTHKRLLGMNIFRI